MTGLLKFLIAATAFQIALGHRRIRGGRNWKGHSRYGDG